MALLSLCLLLHHDMGDCRSEEADSDLAHGVEIEASLPHSASPRRLLLRFRRNARLLRLFSTETGDPNLLSLGGRPSLST